MALPASTLLSLTPKFQIIKLCKHQTSQLQSCSLWGVRYKNSRKCSVKVTVAQMGDPDKVKLQLSIVKERLWEAVPDSAKDFPWQKAEKTMLEKLFVLGQKALKWSLIVLFIFSSLSDAIFSISRNQELMIPFGLLVGHLMTDFLRETLLELFRGSEGKVLQREFLGLGCFFVLVKFMSAFFALQARVFLLHVANGGLMQVLWLWRSLVEEDDRGKAISAED
ncbi:hypothetical protein Ddye_006604 [Dipteronia dyeriana]|uniref:Embryo defective 1273 n=1 Tax=Dipteronia dyeriana TaxID=168575 RepID=A0AAE0CQW1_9ROSI|nr:hypothetical protein Ddye_006604 [Dipteronia dyeriana]